MSSFSSFNSPDSNTKSLTSRPWFPKRVWSLEKFEDGGGMLAVASDDLEITPSLRPVGTSQ